MKNIKILSVEAKRRVADLRWEVVSIGNHSFKAILKKGNRAGVLVSYDTISAQVNVYE